MPTISCPSAIPVSLSPPSLSLPFSLCVTFPCFIPSSYLPPSPHVFFPSVSLFFPLFSPFSSLPFCFLPSSFSVFLPPCTPPVISLVFLTLFCLPPSLFSLSLQFSFVLLSIFVFLPSPPPSFCLFFFLPLNFFIFFPSCLPPFLPSFLVVLCLYMSSIFPSSFLSVFLSSSLNFFLSVVQPLWYRCCLPPSLVLFFSLSLFTSLFLLSFISTYPFFLAPTIPVVLLASMLSSLSHCLSSFLSTYFSLPSLLSFLLSFVFLPVFLSCFLSLSSSVLCSFTVSPSHSPFPSLSTSPFLPCCPLSIPVLSVFLPAFLSFSIS